MFDEVRVIAGEHKLGVIFEKEIVHVGQVNKTIQWWRSQSLLLAKLVAKQSGGLIQIANHQSILCWRFADMMVNDRPAGPVHSCFERQICDPARFFPQIPLLPKIVIVSLETDIFVEKLA